MGFESKNKNYHSHSKNIKRKSRMTSSYSSVSSSSSSGRFFGEEWTLLSTRMIGGKRYACAYASLDDKRHFWFGGWDANGFSRTVVEYNSAFRAHPPLPESRIHSAAIAIDNGRLLVVGGHKTWFSRNNSANSCVVYDTRSKKWSTDWPLLNIGRSSHASVYTTNKKAYVIGGSSSSFKPFDSIEEIDLSLRTPSWKVLPQRLNKKRSGCCAMPHPNNPNNIIVVGGHNGDKYLSCCELICLDPTQEEGQARTLPSMMIPRAFHTLVLVHNHFLVAMGGHDGSRTVSSVEYLDLEEEESQQQQWRPLPAMKTARRCFAAFYSPENHKIVVAGGLDDDGNELDTVEELQALFRWHDHSSRQLREAPRPNDMPSGTMDPLSHQTKIQQYIDETKKQMTGFLESMNEREGRLIQERQENRQLCNEYIAQVSERQSQARRQVSAIVYCMQDPRSTRVSPTSVPAAVPSDVAVIALHQDPRQPPALTKIPPGHMDADHLQDIELWMKETDQKKNAYVAAVDAQEIKINREVKENQRVCDKYLAEIRAMTELNYSSSTADTPHQPNELLCPITLEVMVDPVMTADGHTYERAAIERVFDGTRPGDNVRSPVTGLVLSSRLLTPNVAIRSMCMDYSKEGQ